MESDAFQRSPHIAWAHRLWGQVLRPGDCAVDATVGRGRDLCVLAEMCLGDQGGQVIGLDIQEEALASAWQRVEENLRESQRARVQLLLASHHRIGELVPSPPQLIVFNLGYLPGGDHEQVTQAEVTLQALHASMQCLRVGGALSVTCYPRHPGGAEEAERVVSWAMTQAALGQRVECVHWTARPLSPFLTWCHKLRDAK